MMVPATCAPTAEPMLRMTVLTPVASRVWCSSTAPTMRLGIAAKAAPTPALVMQLQGRPVRPSRGRGHAEQGGRGDEAAGEERALGAAALADSADDRGDEEGEQAAGGQQQARLGGRQPEAGLAARG